MKLKIAPIFFVIFFVFFLVLGMETGQSLLSGREGSAAISDLGPPEEEGSDQDAGGAPFVLLIQVDDMQKEPPHLESVWLMGFGDQSDPLLFFPLLPSQADDGPERDQALREAFAIKEGVQPSSPFFKLLVERNLDWSGYLVMDKSALAAVVSVIERGKVEESGSMVPAWGPGVLNREDARAAQSDFILDICTGTAEMASPDEFLDLFEVFPDRLVLEGLSPATLRQIWGVSSQHEFGGCQFPTLADQSR
jgi:hypothetical protein